MKHKLYRLLRIVSIPFVLLVVSCALNFWLGLFVALCSIVFTGIRIGWKILDKLVKRTNWWRNQYIATSQFVSNMGYRDITIRNYDIVNLGSNPARFAFFYENVVGQSWSTGSQGLDMDFEILKYYHSYLKKGATVLIPVMPFTAISPFISTRNEYWDLRYYSKFYKLLDGEQRRHLPYNESIPTYMNSPLKFYRSAWKYILNDVPPDVRYAISEQPMTMFELAVDAEKWMKIWHEEFKLRNLRDVFNDEWKQYYEEAVSINQKMIDFCLERGYKPVFICVPMTKPLSDKFPEDVKKYLVTNFVAECNIRGVPFLDYTTDERFASPDLYFNSFFLNMRGRKLFTRQVLKDTGILVDGN